MRTTQTTINLTQTEQKIRDFRMLPEGWHFGEGVPPSNERINQALWLHDAAIALGYAETDAFPGVSGEVRVTIYRGQTYLEFTFEANGNATFVHEEGGTEIEYTDNLTFEKAIAKLIETQMRLWATSGSYIPNTMIAGKNDFKASRLKIQPAGVSLSSTKAVRLRKAEPFARTFAPFTQPRLAIPQSSGIFHLGRYLQASGSTLTSAQAGIHVTET